MNCKKCGFLLTENDQFCKNCGEPVNSQNMNAQSVNTTQNVANPMMQPTELTGPINNVSSNTLNMEQLLKVEPSMEQEKVVIPDNQVQTVPNNISSLNEPVESIISSVNTTPEIKEPEPIVPKPNIIMSSQPANTYNQAPAFNPQPVNNVEPKKTYSNNSSSNDTSKYIAYGVAAIAIIAAIICCVLFINKNNSCSDPTAPSVTEEKNVTVSYKGFEFSIPESYEHEIVNDTLAVSTDSEKWGAYLSIIDGSFESIKSNMQKLKINAQNSGYIVSTPEIKVIDNIEYITMELSDGSDSALVLYTKGDLTHVLCIDISDISGKANYDLIPEISSIVKSIKYTGSSNSIQVKENIKASDFIK